MPLDQKQELLETERALELVERVHALYRREVALTRTMFAPPEQDTSGMFSLN